MNLLQTCVIQTLLPFGETSQQEFPFMLLCGEEFLGKLTNVGLFFLTELLYLIMVACKGTVHP